MKLCECGCGTPTTISTKTDRRAGWVKGEPKRWAAGGHCLRGYKTPFEPFDDRYVIEPISGCHIWQRATRPDGYGVLGVNGHTIYAHVFAYERKHGPVPKGLELDHLCRTPLCVNPDHLEAVTHRENILRGHGPVSENARKTHCPKGHPYSGDNLVVYGGARQCRSCRRSRPSNAAYQREWKRKRALAAAEHSA